MTNTLYVQAYTQNVWDNGTGQIAGLLSFVATGYQSNPAQPTIAYYYGTQNTIVNPAIFPNDTTAFNFYKSAQGAALVTAVNTAIGTSFYTVADVEQVEAPVLADFNALATVAKTGNYTDLSGLPSFATVATSGSYNDLINKPSLSTVATTGAYSDLSGKPSIPSAQVNSDWNSVSGISQISNKPTLATVATSGAYSDLTGKPTIPVVQAYDGTTQRLNAFPVFFAGTVASGVVAINLTTNGLSGGTAIFPNGIILGSVNYYVNDATGSYQVSYALTNSNKTITFTANKYTTANLLSGILGQVAANGVTLNVGIWGY